MYYRGYILIRLKAIGTEWKVVNKLTGLKSNISEEKWEVTYVTPVYGGWDIVVECSFNKLLELDKIVSYIRIDEELSSWIEETTTLVSTKADYPEF
ncbi:MAG: hypothetical protein EAX89_13785 [Candidatus Lokiarchaeota archaeon]|nr:hypothetical protein [Candidatus Lokiarchaeota archaeon]